MMLSWRECVLYNGVIRSATVVGLDMVAVTYIIKPPRASIFGEYIHNYATDALLAKLYDGKI